MRTSPERLAVVLARQVVEALAKIGLAQDDILRGEIKHTELPWQVPPLAVEATLFDVPLSAYLDQPMYVNTDNLFGLWTEALMHMKNAPYKVLKVEGTYLNTSGAIPACKGAERPLYLSVPEGFPNGISDMAAVVLSLECAHLVRNNSRHESFVSDEDNYYAVITSGIEIGVKNGLPAVCADIWDLPITGMVQELVRTPRGSVWEGCDHDIVAKVRSLVVEHQRSIRDHEAVDWAVQTLRVIGGQKELLAAVRRVKQIVNYRKARRGALEEAIHIMGLVAMTDRQKVETLKQLLVPDVISISEFSKKFVNFYANVPALMAEKVTRRMKENLSALYDQEVRLYGVEEMK